MSSEIPKTGQRAALSIPCPLGRGGRTQFDLGAPNDVYKVDVECPKTRELLSGGPKYCL